MQTLTAIKKEEFEDKDSIKRELSWPSRRKNLKSTVKCELFQLSKKEEFEKKSGQMWTLAAIKKEFEELEEGIVKRERSRPSGI